MYSRAIVKTVVYIDECRDPAISDKAAIHAAIDTPPGHFEVMSVSEHSLTIDPEDVEWDGFED